MGAFSISLAYVGLIPKREAERGKTPIPSNKLFKVSLAFKNWLFIKYHSLMKQKKRHLAVYTVQMTLIVFTLSKYASVVCYNLFYDNN